jgi:hypothetical protein
MKLCSIHHRPNRYDLTFAALILMASGVATYAAENDANSPSTVDVTVTPDWMIVEDYWYPLRLEPTAALNDVRYHYRRGEEKAAANEIRKAVSWLKLAEDHALPITKEKLQFSERELTALAKDMTAGRLSKAERLDSALARASNALAEYHFFKAKESYGRNEAQYAAQDLEAAVTHLENAAASAHYQYGPDTIVIFDDVLRDGKWVAESRTIDNDMVGKHLDAVEKAIRDIADTIESSAS